MRLPTLLSIVIAVLSAYGPLSSERLGQLLRTPQRRVQRGLTRAWEADLVSCDGQLWRLTARGHARATVLREDEVKFGKLLARCVTR
jgi:hypothetical protein